MINPKDLIRTSYRVHLLKVYVHPSAHLNEAAINKFIDLICVIYYPLNVDGKEVPRFRYIE